MKIIAIIQARMGSSRLPGKSLMNIESKSIIWHVINRIKKSKYISKIVLATSKKRQDSPLLKEGEKIGVSVFAGSELDVLDRFYKAAKKFKAEVIVRITGDCPLIDPEIVDLNIKKFLNKNLDYVHSGMTYPDGIGDCEVFSFKALKEAWNKTKGSDREHVTPYIWKNPALFKIKTIENNEDLSKYILSVDEKNQYEAIKKIFTGLYNKKKNNLFYLKDIIDYVRKHPKIYKMIANKERRCPRYLLKQELNQKYAKSLKLLEIAKTVTPCAAQTYSKSYRYFCEGAAPVFLEKGKGSHVWDIDGNEYIDFICALGAVTIGYNNPKINQAITKQLKKGISFSQPTKLEVKLAKKLIKIIPCAEKVRFLKNGSDATSASIRLARAYTKRDIVAVCGYHGYQDWFIGSTENDLGVPKCNKKLVKKFEYNNIESLKKIFKDYPEKVAAVILEPYQENGPKRRFLEKVKKITHANGAILIFDEVVSGFRVNLAGAQGLYNVVPDLAALGKGMGNGLPISAVVGKKELMNLIEKGVFISTTHGGEALSLTSALATIKILEHSKSYNHLWKLGRKLKRGLQKLISDLDLEKVIEIKGLDILFAPVFKSVGNLTNFDLLSLFQQTMIQNGILVLTNNTLCLEHTDEDIDKYLEAAKKALNYMAIAVKKDSIEDLLLGGKIKPIFKRDSNR